MRNCLGISRSGEISKLSKDKPHSLELGGKKSSAPEDAEAIKVNNNKMLRLSKDFGKLLQSLALELGPRKEPFLEGVFPFLANSVTSQEGRPS